MDQDKKNQGWIILTGIIILSTLLVFHYLLSFGIVSFEKSDAVVLLYKTMHKISQGYSLNIIRGAVLVLIVGILFDKKHSAKNKYTKYALYAAPPLAILYVYGYTEIEFYGQFVYPFIFVSTYIAIPLCVTHFTEESDDKPLGLNKEKDENSISLATTEGELSIKNVNAGIWCEGGAGSGKTASMIIPCIEKFIKEGRAGVIYDYEGDLTEGGGLISKVTYGNLIKYKTDVKFAFFNLTDLTRTVKVNPISPYYIKSFDDALEVSIAIMFNLNPKWGADKDFWADNAIHAFAGAIWHFVHSKPEMATIPHVVEFLLNDFKLAMEILSRDKEVRPYIQPVLAPFLRDAGGQSAGAESSTQFSLGKLRTRESYYVLTPLEGQEMRLDVTNKNNPIMLCLGNAPRKQAVCSPILGSIVQIIRMQMNRLGKRKSIFMFDELPTLYIDKLDKIPAEARKKGVCTFLALQTMAQMELSYGRDKARIIQDNCGNLFIGRTSVESADKISKALGEYKRIDHSRSFSDNGTSHSVRQQFDKLVRIQDITGQPPGHFTGMITGGKPPFYQAQLIQSDYSEVDIPYFNQELVRNGKPFSSDEINEVVERNFQRIIDEVYNYINQKKVPEISNN
jgi:hypothetical protein